MRLYLLQHGNLPDHVTIVDWANDMGHDCKITNLIEDGSLPKLSDFDWLIVLGGIMDVHEEHKYSWMKKEKELIKKAIYAKKIVLGICLGGQLIAEALGAKIFKNQFKELGWHGVRKTEDAKDSEVFASFPEWFSVFQWHYYAFELPKGAVRLYENDACTNQAFEYNGRVIALQFHPEYNADCIRQLVHEQEHKMGDGRYVQPKELILTEHCLLREADALIDLLLTNIADTYGKGH